MKEHLSTIFGLTLALSSCSSPSFEGGLGLSKASPQPSLAPATSLPEGASSDTSENRCILDAKGSNVTSVTISGENCVDNRLDPGGADKDDYHVTISGDLTKDGWNFFSNIDQELTVAYRLGSPGSTTQSISMQIVNCDGVKQNDFLVNTGTGNNTRKLNARRGDRFNIVATVTSGCYERMPRPVYDMLKDKENAFKIK